MFQTHGFEGASMSRISEATGLIKASLYYRFPGGKEQIAEAVLSAVDRRFADHVLKPIDEPGPLQARLSAVSERLREFYADGLRPCLLDTMTLADSPTSIQAHARQTLEFWIRKFTQAAVEAGLPGARARGAAEDAVAAIEGALVLARISGSGKIFRRVLQTLSARLHGQ